MAIQPIINFPKKGKGEPLPPKRGRIKAKIFEDLLESIPYLASRAGKKAGEDGGSSSDDGPAFSSPPPSAYALDSGP
ncbi:hypothetical protein CKAN_01476400 [Cinnamomum micranthum f. kanehirae]|uniref:Uncharacterized protein n=1 Tax=Cinnamomum micranthum f. kanehirae TaxID=337451 RepID=A0A443P557_9MAGN|nr:hypothetical protein CKAN_01476400 [Cinnamomum micranthum f. kanehirae]